MVCPVGSSRMAVMARLLAGGSYSQTTEEVGHQKLAARYVSREVRGADEANLLDEEDMHVFGLEPMVDPLQLVCCNACKKPIKASQYAAHADLCRLVMSANETQLEHEGGRGHKKSPRKGRKNIRAARSNHTTTGSQERFKPIDVGNSDASKHLPDGHTGMIDSLKMDPKRALACVDVTSELEASGVSPGTMDISACLHSTTKRLKLSGGECLPSFNDADKSILDGNTNVQAPLATKVYYSQRRNRLRLELNYLYEMSTKEVSSDLVHPHSPPNVQISDEFGRQSSETRLSKSGSSQLTKNFRTQVLPDSVNDSQTTHVRVTSDYVTEQYPFAGSSGELLESKHQKTGSVPVT